MSSTTAITLPAPPYRSFLDWAEPDGGWTVVELEPGGGVRLAGADDDDLADHGSEPSGYFGRHLSPADARELATALVRAAMEAEDSGEADPAYILAGAVAELRQYAEDGEDWLRSVLNDLVVAYERLTGSTP